MWKWWLRDCIRGYVGPRLNKQLCLSHLSILQRNTLAKASQQSGCCNVRGSFVRTYSDNSHAMLALFTISWLCVQSFALSWFPWLKDNHAYHQELFLARVENLLGQSEQRDQPTTTLPVMLGFKT